MALLTPEWKSKQVSHKSAVRYDSKIVHEVSQSERELFSVLKTLKEATKDKIEYIPLGRIGVTLAALNPVVRPMLGADKKGVIADAARLDLEQDINQELRQFNGTTVTVHESAPFRLYGANNDKLGIRLQDEPSLFGEKVLVERFVRQEYPSASERFGDEIINWEPHITIGTLQPGRFSLDEQFDFADDPESSLLGLMNDYYHEREQFGIESKEAEIRLPEQIALGALRVICDKQAERVF